MKDVKLAAKERRHKEAMTSGEDYWADKGFLAGAAWQREQIRAEIVEWLDCTGVIPKGTSYYAELLGCTEVKP